MPFAVHGFFVTPLTLRVRDKGRGLWRRRRATMLLRMVDGVVSSRRGLLSGGMCTIEEDSAGGDCFP